MRNAFKKVVCAAFSSLVGYGLFVGSPSVVQAQIVFPSVEKNPFNLQDTFVSGVAFNDVDLRSDFEKMRELWQLFLSDHLFVESVSPEEISEISQLLAKQLVTQYKGEISGVQLRFERTLDPYGLVRLPDTFWKELEISPQQLVDLSTSIADAIRLATNEKITPEETLRGQALLHQTHSQMLTSLQDLRSALLHFLVSPIRKDVLLIAPPSHMSEREKVLFETYKVVLLQAGGFTSTESLLKESLLGFFDNDIGKQLSTKKLALMILSEGVAALDSHGSVEERQELSWGLPAKTPQGVLPLGPRVLTTRQKKKFEDTFETDTLLTHTFEREEVALDVLKFHRFNCADADCYQELETQLSAAQKNTLTRGMLIDLRDNPGGYVALLNRALDMFLNKKGKLLYTTWDRKGEKVEDVFDTEKYVYQKPVVILINRNSASAAEFFTAVMKGEGRALVLGEDRSFGKAVVMTPGKLRSNSQVATSSHWKQIASVTRSVSLATLADGTSHQVVGVRPHIEFPGYYQLTRTGEQYLKRHPQAPAPRPPATQVNEKQENLDIKDPLSLLAPFASHYEELIRKHAESLVHSLQRMGGELKSSENPAMGEVRNGWSALTVESLEMQYRLAAQYVSLH